MTLHVLPDIEQRSDEWYEQRRGIVTASVVGRLISSRAPGAIEYECPACCAQPADPCLSKVRRSGETSPIKTMHPERTEFAANAAKANPDARVIEPAYGDEARSLTALLAAERITGHTEPTFISDDMWRGIESEGRAVDVYSEHYAPVTTVGFMVRDDWGFKIGYSPDGLVGEDGLIEIKAPRQKKHLATILDGEVPREHMAQLQCGLLVSGRKWIDFISYNGGMPMWPRRIFPDARWFLAIKLAVSEFEENVAEMIGRYESAIVGLPMTERVVELEMSL